MSLPESAAKLGQAIVPTSLPVPFRPRKRSRLGSSAALLVLGFTGGSDDEWWRFLRNWRLMGMAGRLLLFTARLLLPLILVGIMRRWAIGRLAR